MGFLGKYKILLRRLIYRFFQTGVKELFVWGVGLGERGRGGGAVDIFFWRKHKNVFDLLTKLLTVI